jgi:hypothetical protein
VRDESTIGVTKQQMALWSSPMRIDVNENFHQVMCYVLEDPLLQVIEKM